MKAVKLPRKLKKNLKKVVLKGVDPTWKTSEVKIIKIGRKKHPADKAYKQIALHCYSLGL